MLSTLTTLYENSFTLVFINVVFPPNGTSTIALQKTYAWRTHIPFRKKQFQQLSVEDKPSFPYMQKKVYVISYN